MVDQHPHQPHAVIDEDVDKVVNRSRLKPTLKPVRPLEPAQLEPKPGMSDELTSLIANLKPVSKKKIGNGMRTKPNKTNEEDEKQPALIDTKTRSKQVSPNPKSNPISQLITKFTQPTQPTTLKPTPTPQPTTSSNPTPNQPKVQPPNPNPANNQPKPLQSKPTSQTPKPQPNPIPKPCPKPETHPTKTQSTCNLTKPTYTQPLQPIIPQPKPLQNPKPEIKPTKTLSTYTPTTTKPTETQSQTTKNNQPLTQSKLTTYLYKNNQPQPPKPVTTVDKPAEPTPPIKPTPITPKPKPTQPTNPTTYQPNESGIEGKTAGEVTNYKTRLLEWKKKIEVEERRKEGSPSRRKKVKHPEDITKAKTVKHTTWKKASPQEL